MRGDAGEQCGREREAVGVKDRGGACGAAFCVTCVMSGGETAGRLLVVGWGSGQVVAGLGSEEARAMMELRNLVNVRLKIGVVVGH